MQVTELNILNLFARWQQRRLINCRIIIIIKAVHKFEFDNKYAKSLSTF